MNRLAKTNIQICGDGREVSGALDSGGLLDISIANIDAVNVGPSESEMHTLYIGAMVFHVWSLKKYSSLSIVPLVDGKRLEPIPIILPTSMR